MIGPNSRKAMIGPVPNKLSKLAPINASASLHKESRKANPIINKMATTGLCVTDVNSLVGTNTWIQEATKLGKVIIN